MNLKGNVIPLTFLAAMLVGGCIAQVLIETSQGKPADVNPVLAALAGTAISALFGQQAFLGHVTAAATQRMDMLAALTRPMPTANAATGIGTGAPGANPGPLTPPTGATITMPADRP